VPLRRRWIRLGLSIVYYFISFGILFLYTYHSYFCSRPNGQSHALVIARLALTCAAWDLFASLCGTIAIQMTRKVGDWRGTAPLASTVVAAVGFASMPFLIYRGYGRFLFENTWADVSCVFMEGYGMVFPAVVAPVLAAATFLRELIAVKLQRQADRKLS
jgi:hypothetical protein